MDICNNYFNWMVNCVTPDRESAILYSNLLRKLNNVPFDIFYGMDENRYQDGIDLRYRFGYDSGICDAIIAEELDYRLASVLEVMVALAIRIENDIMSDYNYGDRTCVWFTEMLKSLQLMDMSNNNYNEQYIDNCVSKLLSRTYDYNGKGGLFTVNDPPEDMRKTDIWNQMTWFLNEFINN